MALSTKKIALLVVCIIGSILLVFGSVYATDMIFGTDGEYKLIIDVIQFIVAAGVIFGGVMTYRHLLKDLSVGPVAETSMNIAMPTGGSMQGYDGGYSTEGVFQGGVHNPFANLN